MTQTLVGPEEYRTQARALYGDKVLFTVDEAAALAGCKRKVILNASSANELSGWGTGRNRRYQLWEIYKWEQWRRLPKADRVRTGRVTQRPATRATMLAGMKLGATKLVGTKLGVARI